MAAAIVNLADFGVYPDREEDQTDAVIAALRCMGKTIKGITYTNGIFIDKGKYTIDFGRVFRTLRQEWEAEEQAEAAASAPQIKTRPLHMKIEDGLHFDDCKWDFEQS